MRTSCLIINGTSQTYECCRCKPLVLFNYSVYLAPLHPLRHTHKIHIIPTPIPNSQPHPSPPKHAGTHVPSDDCDGKVHLKVVLVVVAHKVH